MRLIALLLVATVSIHSKAESLTQVGIESKVLKSAIRGDAWSKLTPKLAGIMIPADPLTFSGKNIVVFDPAVDEKCSDGFNKLKNRADASLSLDQPYYTNCMASTKEVKYEAIVANDIFEKTVGAIGLTNPTTSSDSFFCSATKIKNNKIVTARHCFLKAKKEDLLNSDYFGNYFFALNKDGKLIKTGIKRALEAENLDGDYQYSSDFLILELQNNDNDEHLSFSVEPLKEGDLIYLPGVVKDKDKFQLWGTKIGLKGCVVEAVNSENGCFAHMCQTKEGYSGAPIFRVDNNQRVLPQIVGIHIGGYSKKISKNFCLDAKYKDLFLGLNLVKKIEMFVNH